MFQFHRTEQNEILKRDLLQLEDNVVQNVKEINVYNFLSFLSIINQIYKFFINNINL